MAIGTPTFGAKVNNDQTAGLQVGIDTAAAPYAGPTLDTDTAHVDPNGTAATDLPQTYWDRLVALDLDTNANAILWGSASEDDVVTVSSTGTITDVYFTGFDDGTGGDDLLEWGVDTTTATDGQLLKYDGSNVKTVGGDDVYLFIDDATAGLGDQMLVAVDTAGNYVFTVYMEPDISGATATPDFHMSTFQAIDHPGDGLNQPDDEIDLGDYVTLTVSESVVFDFDGTPAGKNLFTMVPADSADLDGFALVVTPDSEVIALNTSKGGGPTTLALFNQMINPNETMVFTFVDDPLDGVTVDNLDQNEADLETNIQFGGLETIDGGSVIVSQTQGPGPHEMRLAAYDTTSGTETSGNGFIDGYSDDDPALISSITVIDDTATPIGTWLLADSGATIDGVTVTFNAGGETVDIHGFDDDYTIEYLAADHQRISITGLAGKFDIGGIGANQPGGTSFSVGQQIVIDDDTGSAAGGDPIPIEEEESAYGSELAGGNEDATPDPLDADTSIAIDGADKFDNTTNTDSSNLLTLLTGGTDGSGVSVTLDPTKLSTLPTGWKSQGGDIKWALEQDGTTEVWTLTGYVNVLGGDPSDFDGGDREVLSWVVDPSDGSAVLTQKDQLDHPAGGGENTLTFNPSQLVQFTDADGDIIPSPNDLIEYTLIDDKPEQNATVGGGTLEEEHNAAGVAGLAGGNEDATPDPLDTDTSIAATDLVDDFTIMTNEDSGTLSTLFSVGTDEPGDFALVDQTSAETWLDSLNLTSQGEDVDQVSISGNVLTASTSTRDVFSLTLSGTNLATYSFALLEQLDHASGNGENTLTIDASGFIEGSDYDDDKLVLDAGSLVITPIDDVPIFKDLISGGATDGRVEFATDGTGEFDFTTLYGSVGTDDNPSATDAASDDTKTYTFTDASIIQSTIPGLSYEIVEIGERIVFFTDNDSGGTDGSGGTTGGFDDGVDIEWFEYTITDQTGSGAAQFKVLKDAPSQVLEFDFTDLPSGQNLHGNILADMSAPDGKGLLVFPSLADLDADGEFTNASSTLNTSKGGGPVTIGNSNQMIDPGEGMYFAFTVDPDDDSVAGVLTQNTADDADVVGFQDLFQSTGAEVEIVQVQGGSGATLDILAYDATITAGPALGDGGLTSDTDTVQESRDFVLNPVNGGVSTTSTVNVSEVLVYDETDTLVYHEKETGGVLVDVLGTIDVDFDILQADSARVSGLDDEYTVQYITDAGHDLVLIQGFQGKFDIGGFNITEGQDTPDQKFGATVTLTDYDVDQAVSNEFTNYVDGTGTFDNDMFDLIV